MSEQSPLLQPTTSVSTITSADLNAAVATTNAITKNGRGPVFCACPHCKILVTTRLESNVNDQVKAQEKKSTNFTAFLFGFVAVATPIFGIWLLVQTGDMAALILPGVAIPFCFLLWLISKHVAEKKMNEFSDLTHFCPLCGSVLGISNGWTTMMDYDAVHFWRYWPIYYN